MFIKYEWNESEGGCSGCSASDKLGVNTYVDAIKYH